MDTGVRGDRPERPHSRRSVHRPAARGRATVPNVTDVEIGVTALDACEALAEAGFLFTWHEDEPAENRENWPSTLPGMPDSASDRVEDQTGGPV